MIKLIEIPAKSVQNCHDILVNLYHNNDKKEVSKFSIINEGNKYWIYAKKRYSINLFGYIMFKLGQLSITKK